MLMCRSRTLSSKEMHTGSMGKHVFGGLRLFRSVRGQAETALWAVGLLCLRSSFCVWDILLGGFLSSFAEPFDAGHCQRRDIRPDDALHPPWKLIPFSNVEWS